MIILAFVDGGFAILDCIAWTGMIAGKTGAAIKPPFWTIIFIKRNIIEGATLDADSTTDTFIRAMPMSWRNTPTFEQWIDELAL